MLFCQCIGPPRQVEAQPAAKPAPAPPKPVPEVAEFKSDLNLWSMALLNLYFLSALVCMELGGLSTAPALVLPLLLLWAAKIIHETRPSGTAAKR